MITIKTTETTIATIFLSIGGLSINTVGIGAGISKVVNRGPKNSFSTF